MELNSTNLKKALTSGANQIYNFYPRIDKLNVFPVPDGDTGTNMHLTISNGIKTISEEANPKLADVVSQFSRGLIMGARGNSGVIFSQIIRGLFSNIGNKSTIKADHIPTMLKNAQRIAYKAVMTPVEGTILTVIREVFEGISVQEPPIEQDLGKLFSQITAMAEKSLAKTPNLLPILKEAGVVDSGGYGLVKFLEGFTHFLNTNEIIHKVKKHRTANLDDINVEIKGEYGYCTEAIVLIKPEDMGSVRIQTVRQTLLGQKCKSIVAVIDNDILKVHAHTMTPGVVLTFLQQFGDFNNVKVDNMNLQAKGHVQSFVSSRKLVNEWAIIPIVPTREIADYFKKTFEISTSIISGKYMNPPVETILDKIIEADSNHVFILANNKNCILVAEHAAKLETLSSVYVIPSRHITEGIGVIIHYNPADTARRNSHVLRQGLKKVRTAVVSRSNKNALLNGVSIKANDYFSLINDRVSASSSNLLELSEKAIAKIITKSSEIITIFYNHNVNGVIISGLKKFLDERYGVEFDFVNAGQITNQLIIGVE